MEKKITLFIVTWILIVPMFAQNTNFNMFDCTNSNNKFFVATNSGVDATPIGLRVGFLCKTGAYVAARFGKGEVYNMATDQSTTKTNLFSVTGGLIRPVYINNSFSAYAYFGAGYGQWWSFRWDSWTKEGYELEGGLMFSYDRFMLNIGTAMLNNRNTYAAWDFTAGIGYRF